MDPYADIAWYYDCEHEGFHADTDFYLALIGAGPILEVGCGSGRVLLPLARAGYEVWGVDRSPAMLRRARERLQGLLHVRLVESDLTQLDLGRSFPVVLISLNALWHVTTMEGQCEALQVLRRHAADGGIVVLDLSNPLSMADRGAQGEVRLRFDRKCDGRQVRGWSAAWDDEGDQELSLSLTYQDRGPAGDENSAWTAMSLRYLYRSEAELMLRLAGFTPLHVYGDYDLEPFSGQSRRILMVARAG